MKDTIALAMVIIAYALGHFGGYRLCKLRVKNLVKKHIQATFKRPEPLDIVYVQLLDRITKL